MQKIASIFALLTDLKMDSKVENLKLVIQFQSGSEDTPHVSSKAPKTKFVGSVFLRMKCTIFHPPGASIFLSS